MQFEFTTSARIVFGPGKVSLAPELARELGRTPLVVTGRSGRLAELFPGAPVFRIDGEPNVETIREGVRVLRQFACDMVIAIGGGSVMDAGKAVAAVAPNSGEPLDYLEVVGNGRALQVLPAPCMAIPTTAGTGSEVTKNAVLGSPEHRVKASLRSAAMTPRVALIDPALTLSLPREMTASTGLDALTQLIEPYVSIRANAITDAVCMAGLERVRQALLRAYQDGSDIDARTGMSLASLLGGIALANAGLGVVHGLAAPIGGMFDAPHGAVCAALLPHGMRANIAALRREGKSIERYTDVARLLTGSASASADAGVAYVEELCREMAVQPLRAFGITESHLPDLARKGMNASSMKANPVRLSEEELSELLQRAL